MCLAVPTRVVRIAGEEAEAEIGGVFRRIGLAFTPEARVGDYVLIHAGFAISVLDEDSARRAWHFSMRWKRFSGRRKRLDREARG
ncbi:MAG: HypC/HybG/HupF family hydrogenase formation chaperone [Thermodesulfobacteriota bacterium]